jgi:hypothetical protein
MVVSNIWNAWHKMKTWTHDFIFSFLNYWSLNLYHMNYSKIKFLHLYSQCQRVNCHVVPFFHWLIFFSSGSNVFFARDDVLEFWVDVLDFFSKVYNLCYCYIMLYINNILDFCFIGSLKKNDGTQEWWLPSFHIEWKQDSSQENFFKLTPSRFHLHLSSLSGL